MADAAETAAGALVSNAVAASTGHLGTPIYGEQGKMATLQVVLSTDGSYLTVEVWDGAHGVPLPVVPSADDLAERGIALAFSLASRWGWHPATAGAGRCVWVVFASPPVGVLPTRSGLERHD
jgi:hypothetical protein